MWTRRFDGPGAKRFALDQGATLDVLTEVTSEAQLAPGAIPFVAAGERVSVENSGESAASMVVCFAPPTFVAALIAASEGAAAEDSVKPAKAASR